MERLSHCTLAQRPVAKIRIAQNDFMPPLSGGGGQRLANQIGEFGGPAEPALQQSMRAGT